MMITNPNSTVHDSATNKTSRNYSDRLFRKLFHDEKRAIELCNALTGEHYEEDTPVQLCPIDENSLLSRYNDVAFVIKDQYIVLCEHQSSISLNMPLRFLPYISDTIYTQLIDSSSLYGRTLIKIPTPKFFVLYNGKEKLSAKKLRLSEAFNRDGGDLELIVRVIDINHKSSDVILTKSPSLDGYSVLVAEIRKRLDKPYSRDKAIKDAIAYCIEQGILADFLKENYEEVCKMLNYEYDAQAEERVIRREERLAGKQEGKLEGKLEGRLEVARKMLDLGIDLETIAKSTGLSTGEVVKLKTGKVIH